mmetsp:Transcript_9816/g.22988  ORF Transcript_9816/g.22988 Transcript_9816/m.22988 type:complete len:201 (-) Transcript_9816:225-827(-)
MRDDTQRTALCVRHGSVSGHEATTLPVPLVLPPPASSPHLAMHSRHRPTPTPFSPLGRQSGWRRQCMRNQWGWRTRSCWINGSSYNGCSRLCKSRSAHHRRSLHLSPSSLSSSSTPKSPRQRTQIQPCWTSSGGVSCPGSIALTTLFALSHTSQWADSTVVGRVEWQSTQKRLHRWSSRLPSFVSMSTVSVCMSAWLGSS